VVTPRADWTSEGGADAFSGADTAAFSATGADGGSTLSLTAGAGAGLGVLDFTAGFADVVFGGSGVPGGGFTAFFAGVPGAVDEFCPEATHPNEPKEHKINRMNGILEAASRADFLGKIVQADMNLACWLHRQSQ
jgi:hypothetical protein